jgi:AcrR family transcriptional regulator
VSDGADGSDWRSRKRDETRERIYAEAMRLFDEHGFERVSVGQIAAAAGVSVPTFYSHFANKDQVVIVPISPRTIHDLVGGQPEGLPPADRVRGAVHAFFARYGGEERDALLARWKMIARTPSLRRRSTEYERTHAALAAAALATDGEVDQTSAAVEVVAAATLAAATWAVLAWAEADGREPLSALLDQAFEALRQA